MELVKGLHIVEGVKSGSTGVPLNVSAIVDIDRSVHLIDSGNPGDSKAIFAYLNSQGIDRSRVKTLILTHLDGDHAGSAADIRKETGCKVMASEFDGRAIAGEKLTVEELKKLFPQYDSGEVERVHAKVNRPSYTPVKIDRKLREGDRLSFAGETQVFHVPGHTPGHIALYLPRLSALIAGDSMNVADGEIAGPNPQFTPSVRQANESLKKLGNLKFDILVTYHSPTLTRGGSDALKRYLSKL